MGKSEEKDELSGVSTTGHEWDGLKELNNPAPRWWLWVFIITVIWSIGYWVVYPAIPTLTGHTKGKFGWTQYGKLEAEQGEIIQRRGEYAKRIEKSSLKEIYDDSELYQFAVAGGKVMFKENCAACHGTGAQGGKGYPNLNDDDWLWGGDIESIYHTIKFGVRSNNPEGRDSQMPAMTEVLKQKEIESVAMHVLNLAGKGAANEAGAKIFQENCASCHGDNGKGGRDFGAPNLTDAIWLYGGDKESITAQMKKPRHGVMSVWADRLPDDTIKQLAVYVHSLGGGEKAKSGE